ncbi:GIY-YIG nuclease family protein [Metabacillus indicus]|uniref:GIY-YIG nuclease family protein n=1 Tax=Metabacillus indicus TaxID=246786 RepID=UPI000A87E772|nr:GIY-YIG nuclease family protein [Metabacillus indicus]
MAWKRVNGFPDYYLNEEGRLLHKDSEEIRSHFRQMYNFLSEDELSWIRGILSDYDPFEISPSYFYKKETEIERNKNKVIVRKVLDDLRNQMMKFTPQELIALRNKNEREHQGIENFTGIYIIHNCVEDIYYVGKSVSVFDRPYEHFVKGEKGNPEIYEDYISGVEFEISLIPLENTSFSSLNELEDNAIRAYDSYHNGYNRVEGNVMDKPIFKNKNYQKVSDLILDRVNETEMFSTLYNNEKRLSFIKELFREFDLPYNPHFQLNFRTAIKEYQKIHKKKNSTK